MMSDRFKILIDQLTLSEVGLEYTYSITVIDRNGVRSNPHTCGNSQRTVVSASDLDFLLVLCALAIIIAVPAIIVAAETIRYRYCKPKSYAHEWDYIELVQDENSA